MRRMMTTAAALTLTCGATAFAQSAGPAVFVSNNGNLEGSVTAFRLNPDGTLTFANRVVTGVRPTGSNLCAGCNAYDLSLSPDGAYLAVAHVAGDVDSITVHHVNSDATLTRVGLFQMGTPIDVVWVNNEFLAVINADSNPDSLVLYRFNRDTNTITQTDAINAGTSSSYLLASPDGEHIWVNDSGAARAILTFNVSPTGILSFAGSVSTSPPFALEIALSPNGKWVYSAGGISDSGNKVGGFTSDDNALLTTIPGSPFVSPGTSPSNVYVSRDNEFLFVGHGTDATVRVLAINQVSGALSDTGFSFDVGSQGTLGDVSSAPGLMFVTDNTSAGGIRSFSVAANGSLTANGAITSTQGISPRSIAVWTPPPACAGDANNDGHTDAADLSILLANFGGAAAGPSFGDFNSDGQCDVADLSILLGQFGCGA